MAVGTDTDVDVDEDVDLLCRASKSVIGPVDAAAAPAAAPAAPFGTLFTCRR